MTIRIGNMLRQARATLLLTQFEIAVKAGVSTASVSNAERNNPISLKVARKIANVLDIDLRRNAA